MSGTPNERRQLPQRGGPPLTPSDRQQQQQERLSQSQERPPGPPNRNQRQSGTPGQNQGLSTMSGNAWMGGERGPRNTSAAGLTEDQHVPVRGYNAYQVREYLLKSYKSDSSGNNDTVLYKAPGADEKNGRSSGPWGSKPNHMANGQDFFVQLRKGIAALQQSGNGAANA